MSSKIVPFSHFLFVSTILALPSWYNCLGRSTSAPNTLDTISSVNWAGAVLNELGGTFTSVTGTFTIPNPSGENGASASVWVGIDGYLCTSAILQTGIDLTVSDGGASHNAWALWYPEPMQYITDIDFSAWDVVKLTAVATSPTSGTATIENLTSGQTASIDLSSTSALCEQSAEWIVEDYTQNGELVPFANLGTVTFTGVEASGFGDYTPSGATIVNIEQNGNTLTYVSADEFTVVVQFT